MRGQRNKNRLNAVIGQQTEEPERVAHRFPHPRERTGHWIDSNGTCPRTKFEPDSRLARQISTLTLRLPCGTERPSNRTEVPTEVNMNMANVTARTLETSAKVISPDRIAALRGKLRGTVALPGEDGYDAARTIWNAMIDRRPALVVRCLSPADVTHAVNLARDEKLLVAVRAGGHNIAGNAVCDGGLLIDLSLMRSVRVDPASRTARVEPGATLADFDKETQRFALATPLGINSTTGVAGLTLGGGFGWITRKF